LARRASGGGNAVRADGFVHVVRFRRSPIALARRVQNSSAWLRRFHVAPRDELLTLMGRAAARPAAFCTSLPGRYAFVS